MPRARWLTVAALVGCSPAGPREHAPEPPLREHVPEPVPPAAAPSVAVVPSAAATAVASAPPSAPPALRTIAPVPRRAVFLHARKSFACAVLDDDEVVCWGGGGFTGKLFGDGTMQTASKPAAVPELRGARELRIGMFGDAICGLSGAGTVSCLHEHDEWSRGPVAGIAGATHLALGVSHACARVASGQVLCWGERHQGALGDGLMDGARADAAPVAGLRDAFGVVAGMSRSCAWKNDGSVWCWGRAEGPNATDTATPVAVPRLAGAASMVSAPHQYCALRHDGQVRCWAGDLGDPLAKRLGLQQRWPDGTGVRDAVAVAVDNHTACAITRAGAVACWGNGKNGRLGDGEDHHGRDKKLQKPRPAKGLASMVEIATSGLHSCARDAAGEVYCWGANGQGECGNGVAGGHVLTPVRVAGLAGVVELALGDSFSCARLGDGSVWCWGQSSWGQMGDGELPPNRPLPVRVALP